MGHDIHPATADRWDDLQALFGERGAFGGCWCMFNRQSTKEFGELRYEPNRAALRRLVHRGPAPGLLAYEAGVPVGWVAIGPREEYGRIQRSRVTKPVDDTPVWSITCFVIHRKHRGRGVATAWLDAAVEFAKANGAEAVEGYPVEPRKDEMPDIYAYMGLASMFTKAGFTEIARRSETRPLMRKTL